MATQSRTKPGFASRHAAPKLSADLGDLFQTVKDMLNPYRPELHYMRGPGPKWRAKHSRPAHSDHSVGGMARAKV